MMNKDFLKRAFKSIVRNRINFLCIFLLAISSAIIIFGFSYLDSITNLWSDWTRKAVDFRTFVVSYNSEQYSEQEAIKELSNFEHVQNVSRSSGYAISGKAFEYVDDNNDGEMYLRGVTKDSINIVYGNDFSGNTNEIICAIKFNPNSKVYETNFDEDNSIDLTEKVGDYMNIKFAGSDRVEKMKIIGLYDSNYDYSAGDVCYATFETVQELNEKYQPEVFDAEKAGQDGAEASLPVYLIIDDVEYTDELVENLQEKGFYAERVISINTEIGDNIVKIVMILAWITCILSFIIILFSNFTRINNRKKEFAIYKAIGYSKKDINDLLYTESIVMSLISGILSLFFGFASLQILQTYFLEKSVEFSRMTVNISFFGIVIGFIVIILIPIISAYISTKKIEEINIISILKE